jgi:hypothetical protein
MKLRLLFEQLLDEDILNEASVADIKSKYYSDIADDVFNQIVSSDPKTVVRDGEVMKVGKYSKLLLSMYRQGNLKLEDLPKANEYLEIVYKRQIPLNANLVNLAELYELVKPYMLNDGETDLSVLIDYLDSSQYEMVLNGSEWYIFKPKDEKAACVLGSGTEWCTTWGPLSTNPRYKDRDNRFNYHNKQGSMYIIINKKDNSDKYQFHVPSRQFMNKSDRQVDLNSFFRNKEEVFLYFNPEFKDLSEHSSDELMAMVTRPLMDSNHKSDLLGVIVELNASNPIIQSFNNSVEENDFDMLNGILGSDFQIDRVGNVFIEFENLDDDDLSVYNGIGGYYNNYDEYVDEEEVDNYVENSWGEIAKGVREDIIIQYNHEGIDIMAYLKDNGIEYGGSYLHGLLSSADKTDKFNGDVYNIISSAKESAKEQAEQEVAKAAEDLFRMGDNEIDKDVFLLYLISHEEDDEYDMESFKDFLGNKFNIATEDYMIYEEIDEKANSYVNVDVKEIVKAYSDLVEGIVEYDIETNSDDYRNYHLKTNPETSDYYQNTDSNEISGHMSELQQEIYGIVKKYTNNYDLYLSDAYRTLRIFDTKINPPKESVYITFKDNVGSNDFEGYIKIKDLPRYIVYSKNAVDFYAKLGKVLSGLGLDNRHDTFENELVKLKIDYANVDVANDLIYIELMDKASGRVDKGMVKVDSLPTYYTNHKLFEALVRFKKLL